MGPVLDESTPKERVLPNRYWFSQFCDRFKKNHTWDQRFTKFICVDQRYSFVSHQLRQFDVYFKSTKCYFCRKSWFAEGDGTTKSTFVTAFITYGSHFHLVPNRAKPNSTNSAPLWVCQLSEPCPSWSSFSSKHTLSIAFVTRSSVNSLNSQVGSLRAQNGLCQSPLLGAALSTLSTLKLVIFTDSVNHLC